MSDNDDIFGIIPEVLPPVPAPVKPIEKRPRPNLGKPPEKPAERPKIELGRSPLAKGTTAAERPASAPPEATLEGVPLSVVAPGIVKDREAEARQRVLEDIARNGLNVRDLATLFGLQGESVQRRLKDCPTKGRERNNVYTYALPRASRFLCEIEADLDALEERIKTMNVKDLPIALNERFWRALTLRRKYMLAAGELWHTADVLTVLGDAFKLIKEEFQLATDKVSQSEKLSQNSKNIIEEMLDSIQSALELKLTDMETMKQTLSFAEDEDVKSAAGAPLGEDDGEA